MENLLNSLASNISTRFSLLHKIKSRWGEFNEEMSRVLERYDYYQPKDREEYPSLSSRINSLHGNTYEMSGMSKQISKLIKKIKSLKRSLHDLDAKWSKQIGNCFRCREPVDVTTLFENSGYCKKCREFVDDRKSARDNETASQ